MSEKFKQLTFKYFKFLVEKYGAEQRDVSQNLVTYKSNKFILQIHHDRGEVFVDVGNPFDENFVPMGYVIQYKTHSPIRKAPFIEGGTDGETEMAQLSQEVKDYCSEFLEGNFSSFDSIKKYKESEEEKFWRNR